MAEGAEPHPADAARHGSGHRLGPHVVGQRVVVRRLLRGLSGPSGGPAMTDVLGTCVAWDAEACVVRTEDGDSVRIRLRDIVTGKPVPPRGSVRDRIPPREAQLHGAALFPDLETEPLGRWVLRRSASRPARRANSVLAFGPPGMDDAVARVVAHYERPIAAVLVASPEEEIFRDAGWVPESSDADTLFQVAGTAQVARALRTVDDAPVELQESGGPATADLAGVATGVAAFADDWLGFSSIHVEPNHRRRGAARQIMAALVGWGAEQGATTCYLQVLADNEPALALYEGLGFRTHHTYRYLTPAG